MAKLCPLCENGQLEEKVEQDKVKHRGITGITELCFSVCDYCESEQANSLQTTKNKESMINFRKSVDESLKTKDK